MKTKSFPNKHDWNKIVEEAFSSDDTHDFSAHYELRKERMQRGITMTKNTDRKRTKIIAAAVASVAAIALIPTSVYAYNRISANISKTDNYQTTVQISTPESISEPIAENSDKKFMYYRFNWLPDGYVREDTILGDNIIIDPVSEYEPFVNFPYVNKETNGEIMVQFYDLPKDTNINIDLPFSENCENYTSGDKTAMINYRTENIIDMTIAGANSEQPGFSRQIFVTFGETSYLAVIYLSDDISEEDMLKLIDNMELIQTEEKRYNDYIPFLDKDNSSTSSYEETLKNVENMNVVNIGDTAYYDNNEEFGGFSFTLDSAEYIDNFDGINTDSIGMYADYSHYMDENGSIVENIRSIVEYGNGVTSKDEVIAQESIPMHILKIKATFTNTRDVENEIGIEPTLFVVQDGTPLAYGMFKYKDHSYIDSVSGLGGSLNFFSMDTAPEKKGSKNAVHLAPGESAEVQLAFWVPDDLKDETYLMHRIGYGYDNQINKGSPVFDVRYSSIN